jgi:periplasmic protein TonB
VAFDGFRGQSQARPSAGRRLTVALSIAFHGALLAAGVAYSFWHIDELTPPSVKVTFLMAAPPPPPPPPPAGGGGARKRVAVKPKLTVQPTTSDIVQPREIPKAAPQEKPKPDDQDGPGEKGGVKGGVVGGTIGGTIGGTVGGKVGGVIGGTIGGTGAAPVAAKFLAPNIGAGQKSSGADPPFPPSLDRAGVVYRVLAKICVTAAGSVDKVTILKGVDPTLDDGVMRTVKTWRFRPYMANNTPIPFCYPANFEFRGQ